MIPVRTRRGHEGNKVDKEHLKLSDLEEKARGLTNNYLFKTNIPPYPQPEFHVRHLKHDTDSEGLRGIKSDNGFKNPGKFSIFRAQNLDEDSLLWWSLAVGPEEMASAEKRLLETTYPDRTEEQAQAQQSFLGKFATSPAFKKTSRMGPYRFTFPLEELLKAYSEQFCSGAQPVMRVLSTVLFKQEVMYVVVVHSPANEDKYSGYPLLGESAVCVYKDGCFIWRSEAMSETHSHELVLSRGNQQMEVMEVDSFPQFYVWDNVAVALHVDKQVLNLDDGRLRENLRFCVAEKPGMVRGVTFEDFPKAECLVQELWPNNPSPLEKDE